MSDSLKTDVLIVGAGPTGLMAANQLARFGVDFIIIDKKEHPTMESRAIVVTARSLEIYQQLGLEETVIETGKKITSFKVYSNGKRKAHVNLGEIGKGFSQFSYILAFEQSKNEVLLANALVAQNKSIHWRTELLQIIEQQDRLKVEVKSNDSIRKIEAKYLIACDGANSAVRQQLKFSFEGGTYDHKFFVADTQMEWKLDYHQLIVSPGTDNFCAFLPLYGDHSYRVLGTLPKEFANRDDVTFTHIEYVIKRNIGVPLTFTSVRWFSVYKLHHRCVDHFREGRIFLAGDSAHIHSPAGGQGMNTGLQDAYNLCWKLAFVLKGMANQSLLDTYNEERLPFAQWLLNFTDQGFNLMTNENSTIQFLRKYIGLNILKLALSFKWARTKAFKTMSQIWYSYNGKSLSHSHTSQRLAFHAGDRVPYVYDCNVHLSLKEAVFHVIYFRERLTDTDTDALAKFFPFPTKVVGCAITDGWNKLGVTGELFVLVRPDNYIALISDKLDQTVVNEYLMKYFIIP